MRDYYTLSNRGRAMRLRRLAISALADYDLDVKNVRLITNDFNAIFRIDTMDGQKYVLRVCRPTETETGLPQLRSEMMWLDALRRDTDLQVPEPLKTRQGTYVTTAQVDRVPEPRHCVIFSWLPGRDIDQQLNPHAMEKLGAFAAQLHRHAASWTPPDGFSIGRYDTPFPFEPRIMFDNEYQEMLSPARRALFEDTASRIQDAINCRNASGTPMHVIHADLHRWNVKVYRGCVSAFDFQEVLWGWDVQDIAITLYYLHGEAEYSDLRDAFQRGYTRIASWPETCPGEIDLFIAGRGLMLANGLLTDVDPEWRSQSPRYFERTEARLRALFNGEPFQLRYW